MQTWSGNSVPTWNWKKMSNGKPASQRKRLATQLCAPLAILLLFANILAPSGPGTGLSPSRAIWASVCARFVAPPVLLSSPSYIVMALGIGANVALFTVVRGVLLKPLPFQDPDRLVMLHESGLQENDAKGYTTVSGGMYAEWKKENQSFSSLALARGSRVGLSGSGGQLPEKLYSAEFIWDLLRTLGVQA